MLISPQSVCKSKFFLQNKICMLHHKWKRVDNFSFHLAYLEFTSTENTHHQEKERIPSFIFYRYFLSRLKLSRRGSINFLCLSRRKHAKAVMSKIGSFQFLTFHLKIAVTQDFFDLSSLQIKIVISK